MQYAICLFDYCVSLYFSIPRFFNRAAIIELWLWHYTCFRITCNEVACFFLIVSVLAAINWPDIQIVQAKLKDYKTKFCEFHQIRIERPLRIIQGVTNVAVSFCECHWYFGQMKDTAYTDQGGKSNVTQFSSYFAVSK